MIGILLKDASYEQDIRELLMAFYPGETFAHERTEEAALYVEGEFEPEGREAGPEGRTEDQTEDQTEGSRGEDGGFFSLRLLENGETLAKKRFPVRYGKRLETGEPEESIRSFMADTYLTSGQKIDLCVETAKRERSLLEKLDYEKGYSLYVGIPFCPTTCLYCSFTSYPISAWEKKIPLYLDALFQELTYTAKRMKGRVLDTIYFGGGTPTSLKAEELDAILSKIEELFDLSAVQEITVEAGRPDSITEEKLKTLRRHGITRISINPQTMKQATLELIGRRHTVQMVKEQFHMARELGFDNINMDLIIGLPEEDLADVRDTLDQVEELAPESLTVHSLAIKRAARLNMFRERYAGLKIQNTQEMIDLTASRARAMGLHPYYLYRQKNMAGNFENVGYAAPGKECLYNVLIMEEKQTILACGAGTTTKVVFPSENRLERVENVKDVGQYIERIGEMLERKEKMLEKLE